MQRLLILLIGFTMLLASCHKDSDNDDVITETPGSGVVIENATKGILTGTVADTEGNPVSGVSINSLGKSTTTDDNGFFIIKDATLAPTGIYVTAIADGYHLGSDMVYSTTQDAHSKIVMIPLKDAESFSSSTGGTVAVKGGGEIIFPAEAIVKNGQPYSGSVKVYAQRIATDAENFSDMMPGGLFALDSEGRSVVLASAGMVAVELRGENGEELQLKEGATARTTFPIAADISDAAPEVIALWSFDEVKGLWIEEGEARRKGDVYEAELSHFSFWNCDAPFPLIKLQGQVKDGEGNPLKNYRVEVQSTYLGTAYGYTDQDGYFCGLVPKGENLTLNVYSYFCQEDIYTNSYGPYDNDVDLGMIIVTENSFTFNGTLLCDGELLNTGYIIVNNNGQSWNVYADEGSFSYTIHQCEDITSFTLQGVDYVSGKASDIITYDVNNISENIEIQVCNPDCDLTLDITTNEDEICDEDDLMLTAVVTGGSGDYSYLWFNEETTQSIAFDSLESGSTACVEITDNQTGCSQNFCKTIQVQNYTLFFEYYYQFDCSTGEAEILIWPGGGEAPYTAYVDGQQVATDITSQETSLGSYQPGVYDVRVVDAKGCESTVTMDVLETGSLPIEIATADGTQFICGEQTLFVNVNVDPNNAIYTWSNGSTESILSITEPGVYCVTVDLGGCIGENCISIFDPFVGIESDSLTCGVDGYELQQGNNLQVDYTNNTYEELIDPNNPDQVTAVITFSDDCTQAVQYDVFNEIALEDFEVNGLTCGTCSDGYVTWTNNSDNVFCGGCQFNSVQIYNVDDLATDLFDQNDNQALPAGDYVFIGTWDDNPGDPDYGCVIIRKEFTIE